MIHDVISWRNLAAVLAALVVAAGPASAQESRQKWADVLVAQAKVNPDSESELRKAISAMQRGAPDYQSMEPMLRIAVEQQYPMIKSRLIGLGTLQKLEFVGPQAGSDVYKATFQNGVTSWAIQISPSGKVAGLYFQ